MNSILAAIAKRLAEILVPIIVGAIAKEISDRMPELIRAVTIAITETLQATGDKAVDVIPGNLDNIIWGRVRDILGWNK